MQTHNKLVSMAQIALLAAIAAVLSQIAIPMPTNVPLTLQTFAMALIGYFGGIRKGLPAIGIYIALGAVGVPVFSNMRGGISVLLSFTGGFIWGFLLLVLLCGIGKNTSKIPALLLGMAGLALCHICGVLQYAVVAKTDIVKSFLLVSAPYLLKDAASIVVGYLAALALHQALKRANLAV